LLLACCWAVVGLMLSCWAKWLLNVTVLGLKTLPNWLEQWETHRWVGFDHAGYVE